MPNTWPKTWLHVLDHLLRPARPRLERCLAEREHHLAARRTFLEARTRAIADCERRIEEARARVFANHDGVVTLHMTDLEREWRRLSRPDPEAGLMDFWARAAPSSWVDRKRWRDSPAATRLDAAVALAADVENIEAAEAAVGALRATLASSGARVGSRIRWRLLEHDAETTRPLLAEPLRIAREACPPRRAEAIEIRALRIERDVHDGALARFPERPHLARDLGHAARVDVTWRAASLPEAENPVNALRALWTTGYVLSEVDASSVTLEIPRL